MQALRSGNQKGFIWVWCLLVFLYVIHALRYIHVNLDDQYIVYKYSFNLAQGNGLVYNPGEPLEGFTTFLYVVIMAVVFLLSGITDTSPESIVMMTILGKGFGLICTFGTLAYLVWLLKAVIKLRPMGVFVSLLPLAASLDFVYSSTNGLETGLVILAFSGMVTHFFLFCTSDLTRRTHVFRGLGWVAVLIITRADGMLLAGVFLASWFCISWLRFADQRAVLLSQIWRIVVTVIGVAAGYEIFRWLYFHDLLANTYYVKLAGKANGVFDICYWGRQGYVEGFWRWVRPLLFYIAPSLWAASVLSLVVWVSRGWMQLSGSSVSESLQIERPELWPLLTSILSTVILVIYICIVGGDWMPGSRYVMQFASVYIAISIGTFVSFGLSKSGKTKLSNVPWLLAYVLLIGISLFWIEKREKGMMRFLAGNGAEINMPYEHSYSVLRSNLSRYQLFSLYSGFLTRFAARVQPGDTVAFYEAGSPALRLGSQIRFIDISALNNRIMARAGEGGKEAEKEGIKSLCLNFLYLPDVQVRGIRDNYILSTNAKAIVFDSFIPKVGNGLPATILGGRYVLLTNDSYENFFSVYWRRDALKTLSSLEKVQGLKPWQPAMPANR